MTGRIITFDHSVCELPALLFWNLKYTGSVPCDCFSVTCLYDADMAEPLHGAVGFLAMNATGVLLRGIVDEYTIHKSSAGRTVTIEGRGLAARLLDNESSAITYASAALPEILRNHVTPYGIACGALADVRADSVYTVASGSSQWKALDSFCRTYGGFSPRFSRDGTLLAAPETAGSRRLILDESARLLSFSKRENHYGVLSEVLVIDKKRNVSYSVKNAEFANRGGQCRRVLYTPGQSTWAAMRYTGEYQIEQSRTEEVVLTACLSGTLSVSPGDRVGVELSDCGVSGDYRVAETENDLSENGETTTLTMKECE